MSEFQSQSFHTFKSLKILSYLAISSSDERKKLSFIFKKIKNIDYKYVKENRTSGLQTHYAKAKDKLGNRVTQYCLLFVPR